LELGRPLASLQLKLQFSGLSKETSTKQMSLRNFTRRFVSQHPRVFSNLLASIISNAREIGSDSFDLFDAVFRTTTATYIIDSSKDPFRFRVLYNCNPERVFGIMLGRHYCGAVHSKMKRGRKLEKSAKAWATRMMQMKVLTESIPADRLIRVRYEDLCHDPHSELRRICDFLKIDFAESLLARPSTNVHHLGGSPSKFDPARKTIELDQSYKGAFTEKELAIMRDIVGDIAKDWEYA
jgi:hypothetical protein